MNVKKSIDGAYSFLWSCARVLISCMLIVQMSIPAVLAEVNSKHLSEAETVKKIESLFEVEVVEAKVGGVLILKAQSERIFSGISETILAKALENKIGQRGSQVKRIRIEFKQCAWEKEDFCEIELLTDKDPGFGSFWKGFFKGIKEQAYAESTNSTAIIFGLLGYAAGGPAAQALLIARVMKAATVASIAWLIIDFKLAMDAQDYERAGELLGRALVLTLAATVSFKISKGFRKSGGGVKIIPGRVLEAKPNGTPNKGLPPKPHGSTPVKNPPVKGVTVAPKAPATSPVQGKSLGANNSATTQVGGDVVEVIEQPVDFAELIKEPTQGGAYGNYPTPPTKSVEVIGASPSGGAVIYAGKFVVEDRAAHDAFVAWRRQISSEEKTAKLNAIRQMLWDLPSKINENNVNPAATEYLVDIAEVVFKGKEDIARVIPEYVKYTAEAIKDPAKRGAFINRVESISAKNKSQAPWVKETRKVAASYAPMPVIEEPKDDFALLNEAMMQNMRSFMHVQVMLRFAEKCRRGEYTNESYCEKLRYFYYLWASQAGRVKKDEGTSSLSDEETAKRKKAEEEEAKQRAREEASLSAQTKEYVQAQIEYVSDAIKYLENLNEKQMPVMLDVLESIEDELQQNGKKLGDYIVEIAVAIYHTHKTGKSATDTEPASPEKLRAIVNLKKFLVTLGLSEASVDDQVRALSQKGVEVLGELSDEEYYELTPEDDKVAHAKVLEWLKSTKRIKSYNKFIDLIHKPNSREMYALLDKEITNLRIKDNQNPIITYAAKLFFRAHLLAETFDLRSTPFRELNEKELNELQDKLVSERITSQAYFMLSHIKGDRSLVAFAEWMISRMPVSIFDFGSNPITKLKANLKNFKQDAEDINGFIAQIKEHEKSVPENERMLPRLNPDSPEHDEFLDLIKYITLADRSYVDVLEEVSNFIQSGNRQGAYAQLIKLIIGEQSKGNHKANKSKYLEMLRQSQANDQAKALLDSAMADFASYLSQNETQRKVMESAFGPMYGEVSRALMRALANPAIFNPTLNNYLDSARVKNIFDGIKNALNSANPIVVRKYFIDGFKKLTPPIQRKFQNDLNRLSQLTTQEDQQAQGQEVDGYLQQLCATELFKGYCAQVEQKSLLKRLLQLLISRNRTGDLKSIIGVTRDDVVAAISRWVQLIESLSIPQYYPIKTYLAEYRDRLAEQKLLQVARRYAGIFYDRARVPQGGAAMLESLIKQIFSEQRATEVVTEIFYTFATFGTEAKLLTIIDQGIQAKTLSWIISTLLRSDRNESREIAQRFEQWQSQNLQAIVDQAIFALNAHKPLREWLSVLNQNQLNELISDLIRRRLIDEFSSIVIEKQNYMSARRWIVATYQNHNTPFFRDIAKLVQRLDDWLATGEAQLILNTLIQNANVDASYGQRLSQVFSHVHAETTLVALRLLFQASRHQEFMAALANGNVDEAIRIIDEVLAASRQGRDILNQRTRNVLWSSPNPEDILARIAALRLQGSYAKVIAEVFSGLTQDEIVHLIEYVTVNNYAIHFGNLIDSYNAVGASTFIVAILEGTSDQRLEAIAKKIKDSLTRSVNRRVEGVLKTLRAKSQQSENYARTYRQAMFGLLNSPAFEREAIASLVRLGLVADFMSALARFSSPEARSFLRWAVSQDPYAQHLRQTLAASTMTEDIVDRFENEASSNATMVRTKSRILGKFTNVAQLRRLLVILDASGRWNEFMTLLTLGEGHEDRARTLLHEALGINPQHQDLINLIEQQREELVHQETLSKAEALLRNIESEWSRDPNYKISWDAIFPSFNRQEMIVVLQALVKERAQDLTLSDIKVGKVEQTTYRVANILGRNNIDGLKQRVQSAQETRLANKVNRLVVAFDDQSRIHPEITPILQHLFQNRDLSDQRKIYRKMALKDEEQRFYNYVIDTEVDAAAELLAPYLTSSAPNVRPDPSPEDTITRNEFTAQLERLRNDPDMIIQTHAKFYFEGLTLGEKDALVSWLVNRGKAKLLLELIRIGAINAAINLVTKGLSGTKDALLVTAHQKFKDQRANHFVRQAEKFLKDLDMLADKDDEGVYIRDHILIGLLPEEERQVAIYLSEKGRLEEIWVVINGDSEVEQKIAKIQKLVISSLNHSKDAGVRLLAQIIGFFRGAISTSGSQYKPFSAKQKEVVIDRIVNLLNLPEHVQYKQAVFKSRNGSVLSDEEIELVLIQYFSTTVTASKLELYTEIEYWVRDKNVRSFRRRIALMIAKQLKNVPEIKVIYEKYFGISVEDSDYSAKKLLDLLKDMEAYETVFGGIPDDVVATGMKMYFKYLDAQAQTYRLKRKQDIMDLINNENWVGLQSTLNSALSSVSTTLNAQELVNLKDFAEFLKIYSAETRAWAIADEMLVELTAILDKGESPQISATIETIFQYFGNRDGNPQGEMYDFLRYYFKPTPYNLESGRPVVSQSKSKLTELLGRLERGMASVIIRGFKLSITKSANLPEQFKRYYAQFEKVETEGYRRSEKIEETEENVKRLHQLEKNQNIESMLRDIFGDEYEVSLQSNILKVVARRINWTQELVDIVGQKDQVKLNGFLKKVISGLRSSGVEDEKDLAQYLELVMQKPAVPATSDEALSEPKVENGVNGGSDVIIPKPKSNTIEWTVVLKKSVEKTLPKLPKNIQTKFTQWQTLVERDGPEVLSKTPSFDDKSLRNVDSDRQSRLNQQYRVRYSVDKKTKRVVVDIIATHNDIEKGDINKKK